MITVRVGIRNVPDNGLCFSLQSDLAFKGLRGACSIQAVSGDDSDSKGAIEGTGCVLRVYRT